MNNEKIMVFTDINDEPKDEVQAATRMMQVATGDRVEQPDRRSRRFRLEMDGDEDATRGRALGHSSTPSGSIIAPISSFCEEGFRMVANAERSGIEPQR